MKQIHYSGISARYRDGKGIPLLFIHGFCEDSRMWEDLASKIPNHPVLCPDLPGFGNTQTSGQLTIKKMAEAIQDLTRHLGWNELLCFGHSMGGYVGLAFAEYWPELLSGLGLLHSHPYADSHEKKMGRNKAIDFLETHGVPAFVRQLIPTLFASSFLKENPETVSNLIMQASGYNKDGIISALQAMRDRPDRSQVLKNFSAPTLFLIGTEDKAIPEEFNSRQVHVPAVAEVMILEGVGHMGIFESPERTLQAICRFISLCETHEI